MLYHFCNWSSTFGYARMCFRLFQRDNSEAYVDEVIYVDNCLSISSWSYKSITWKNNGIFVQKHLIMGIYSVFTVFIFFVILCSVKCDLCVTLFTLWGTRVIGCSQCGEIRWSEQFIKLSIYPSIHFHLSSWWDCGADSLSWEAYRSIISQAHPRSSLGPSPGTTGQENVSQKAF